MTLARLPQVCTPTVRPPFLFVRHQGSLPPHNRLINSRPYSRNKSRRGSGQGGYEREVGIVPVKFRLAVIREESGNKHLYEMSTFTLMWRA